MLLVNWAITNVVDGDVHEFSASRSHDDVLHTLRKNCIFVLSFSELLGISCHSGDHGPELVESFLRSQNISIETFVARGKMNE